MNWSYVMWICTAAVIGAGVLTLIAVCYATWHYYAVRATFWRKVRKGAKALPGWNAGSPPEAVPIVFLLQDDPEIHFGIRKETRVETPRMSAHVDGVCGWLELPEFPKQWQAALGWRSSALM